MGRRSRLQVFMDVLETIKRGVQKPTKIMYDTNLSWQPLVRVLKSLTEQGLIEVIDPRKIARREQRRYDKRTNALYLITQKGEDTLRHFNEGKDMIYTGAKDDN